MIVGELSKSLGTGGGMATEGGSLTIRFDEELREILGGAWESFGDACMCVCVFCVHGPYVLNLHSFLRV